MSAALGFVSAGCAVLAVRALLVDAAPRALARGVQALAGLTEVVAGLGREGREPGALERRRLLLAGAGGAWIVGSVVLGPLPGLALAAGGPAAVARALRLRRARYRRALEAGVPAAAVAIADALGGGHSLRGAVQEAAAATDGAIGHELRRTVAELAAGARTADALAALRGRGRCGRLDTLVAACLLQQRAGGNLARLLRETARSMEDEARLAGELRAATAQARFTGLLVVLLPLGGAVLAELASPGFLAGLTSSLLTTGLVVAALVLQLLAGLLIHRLGQVRW
jgi:tight adherence protein B